MNKQQLTRAIRNGNKIKLIKFIKATNNGELIKHLWKSLPTDESWDGVFDLINNHWDLSSVWYTYTYEGKRLRSRLEGMPERLENGN